MSSMSKKQQAKGDTFMDEANVLIKKSSSSWFASGKERKLEEAADALGQSANAYKVGGFNQEAGNAYMKSAELFRDSLSQSNEASKAFQNAGNCYKKSNAVDALNAFQEAISILTDAGRITQAAKLSKECAELYENDEILTENEDGKGNVVMAIESYEQAAELFGMEAAKSQSSSCMVKIAELCSVALDPPDFIRAAQIYDELGRKCLQSALLKFNAKGYFLQAILCHLAVGDPIGANQAISRFTGQDYTFSDSREGKFGVNLVESVDNNDPDQFSTLCMEYDRISKLDPWKTSMLVKVKRQISDDDEDNEDDEDALNDLM